MPSPRTSCESSSPMFGSPAQSPDGVKSIPIVGLESTPITTTSSPDCTCCSITAATSVAIFRQCFLYTGVSNCSRTPQKRRAPPNASSGHGICRITYPCSCKRSMTGSHIAGRFAPPSTFEFWFSRQCAMNATRATSEREQDLAELARLRHVAECLGGLLRGEDLVDDRLDSPVRQQRDDVARERLHRARLLLERPRAQRRPEDAAATREQRAQRDLRLRAGTSADHDDAAPHRQSAEIVGEIRCADELEHDVGATLRLHTLERLTRFDDLRPELRD